ERHGGKLHISSSRLAAGERWFARWGAPVIVVGRLVPFVRTFISYPAGISRMAFGRFIACTALGGFALSLGFGYAGKQVGHNWTKWKDQLHYVDYAVVVLIV